MKRFGYLAALVILGGIATLTYANRAPIGDPGFLAALDAPGSMADRLGRPVKWIDIEFEDGFFEDFDNLNASGDLEKPWQTNVLADQDTVAVALVNWSAIDDIEDADHLPIARDQIREQGPRDPLFMQRFRFHGPDGEFKKYYNMIFFNMSLVETLPEPCRALLVYEVVRMMGIEEDIEKVIGNTRIKACLVEHA